MKTVIRIQPESFDVGIEVAALEGDDAGAVVTFTGFVRHQSAAGEVSAIELEHYAGMTEKSLQLICAEAASRWPLLAATVIHRIGYLSAGAPIVLVGVSSVHREAAFQGASFLMDWLKTRAPFWKKEWVNGEAMWVASKASDAAAADRWQPTAPPVA
ncbi:MAG: molybdenum cofactor biosynthesis protein MoaE [bacterium]|nr:molybdenum cofactor biosynthesis protein MoaE [bacterium]